MILLSRKSIAAVLVCDALGIADNAMPGSKIERIKRITEMVEQRGSVPIATAT